MGSLAGLPNPAWLAAGLAGVFLTAYYSFRMIFILLLPPTRLGKPATGQAADRRRSAQAGGHESETRTPPAAMPGMNPTTG